MEHLFLLCLLLPASLALNVSAIYKRYSTTGCEQSNEGNLYYLTFMSNIPDQPKNVPVEIYVATMAESATVTVETSTGHKETKTIRCNQIACFQIPREVAMLANGNGKSTRTCVIRVSSDQKIVVYGANKEQYTTDAFLALPENVIGTQYYAVTWFPPTNYAKPDYCQIAIAGTREATTVEVTLPKLGGGLTSGQGFRVNDQYSQLGDQRPSGPVCLPATVTQAPPRVCQPYMPPQPVYQPPPQPVYQPPPQPVYQPPPPVQQPCGTSGGNPCAQPEPQPQPQPQPQPCGPQSNPCVPAPEPVPQPVYQPPDPQPCVPSGGNPCAVLPEPQPEPQPQPQPCGPQSNPCAPAPEPVPQPVYQPPAPQPCVPSGGNPCAVLPEPQPQPQPCGPPSNPCVPAPVPQPQPVICVPASNPCVPAPQPQPQPCVPASNNPCQPQPAPQPCGTGSNCQVAQPNNPTFVQPGRLPGGSQQQQGGFLDLPNLPQLPQLPQFSQISNVPANAAQVPYPQPSDLVGSFPFRNQVLGNDDDTLRIYAAYMPKQYSGQGDPDGYIVRPDSVPSAPTGQVACEVEYNGRVYRNGETIQIQLQPLEAVQLQAKCDLTGTYIKSSRPVSVYSGNARTAVGPGAITRDHLVEQLPPVTTWGRTFVTIPTPHRSVGDYYKIVAAEPNTQVSISGRGLECQTKTLQCGEFWEVDLPCQSYAYIVASKPILVVHFTKSQTVVSEPADPASTVIMPIEQFGTGYTFNTVEGVAVRYQNYMTVAVQRGKEQSLILDGVPITPAEGWSEVPGTNVTIGYVTIQPGTHTVTSQNGDTRFAAYIYGAGDRESYAYPTGMCLKQLTCPQVPGCCCVRCDRGLGFS